MAANCFFVPLAMLGLVGVTAIDRSVLEPELESSLPHPVSTTKMTTIISLPNALNIAPPCLLKLESFRKLARITSDIQFFRHSD